MKFHTRKMKTFYEQKSADYEFLSKLAQACMGGGGNSETIGIDDGNGAEDMTPEQEAAMRAVLGDDFDRVYNR